MRVIDEERYKEEAQNLVRQDHEIFSYALGRFGGTHLASLNRESRCASSRAADRDIN